MVIALLAVLGVDLIVMSALVLLLLARRRWVKAQPGAFRGAIRVTDGEVRGLRSGWSRGYGRWVRDVLVWTKGPFLLVNEVLGVDAMIGQGSAPPGEIRHLRGAPVIVRLTIGTGEVEVEVAVATEAAGRVRGPFESEQSGGVISLADERDDGRASL